MVKGRGGPVHRRRTVTQRAILRESRGFVRRVHRPVVVAQMAIDAGPAGQVVVVIGVARRALLGSV